MKTKLTAIGEVGSSYRINKPIPAGLLLDSSISDTHIKVVGFARYENPTWADREISSCIIRCSRFCIVYEDTKVWISLPSNSKGIRACLLRHPQTLVNEWRIMTVPSVGEVADFTDRVPLIEFAES
jgi:hypothetical protein